MAIDERKVMNGTHGSVFLDGEEIAEVKAFQAKLEFQKEEVKVDDTPKNYMPIYTQEELAEFDEEEDYNDYEEDDLYDEYDDDSYYDE